MLQEFHGAATVAAPAIPGPQGLQVAAQLLQGQGGAVDEIAAGSSARQGFQAEGTAAREQVEATCPVDIRREPVKQGFSYPVGGRSQAVDVRKAKLAATPLAAKSAMLPCPAGANRNTRAAMAKMTAQNIVTYNMPVGVKMGTSCSCHK